MMTQRQFDRAVDAHVTGLYNPFAPFNQEEHPFCKNCVDDDCVNPCQELVAVIENDIRIRQAQEAEWYFEWCKEQIEYGDCDMCHQNYVDFVRALFGRMKG